MAKKASTSEKMVRQIRRKSRKKYSGEEKIRIADQFFLRSARSTDITDGRHQGIGRQEAHAG